MVLPSFWQLRPRGRSFRCCIRSRSYLLFILDFSPDGREKEYPSSLHSFPNDGTDCESSTATPHPLLPNCFCFRPSFQAAVVFHSNFQKSFWSQISHVISLLIVFSVNVLHVLADVRKWVRHSGFPPLPSWLGSVCPTLLSPHIRTVVRRVSEPTGDQTPNVKKPNTEKVLDINMSQE